MKQESGYRYDVFISYNAADRDWASTVLLPRLERAGLRVAIDYRDFVVGKPLIENIEDAVEASRRTIVVLGPAWVASEWNAFEALLLRTEDPAATRRKLLPLRLHPCDLPAGLAKLKLEVADLTAERYKEAQLKRLVRDVEDVVPVPLPAKVRDWGAWQQWLKRYRRGVRLGLGALLLVWLVLSLAFELWPFQRRWGWQVVGRVEARPAHRLFRVDDVLLASSDSTPSDCNARDTGLARSTDEGSTWLPVSGDPLLIEQQAGQCPRANVSDFAIASRAGRTIVYAATIAPRTRNTIGLLRSTDLGFTWSPLVAVELHDVDLTNVIVLDSDPERLVVAVNNVGLLRTLDGGISWQSLDATCPGHPELRLPPSLTVHSLLAWGPAVYAGTDEGLYASEDGGDCWTQQGSGEGRQYSYTALSGIPGRPDQLLALTRDGTTTLGAANHFLWLVERGRGRVGSPLWSAKWTTEALYIDPQVPSTWYVASNFGPMARGSLDAAGHSEELPTIRRCAVVFWLFDQCLADLVPDAASGPPLLLAGSRIYRFARGPWLHRYWP